MSAHVWKNGRGKLGVFSPLMGLWRTQTESELGHIVCTREFSKILDGKYVKLSCHWDIGTDGKSYDEHALFGVTPDKKLHFWSFTSDGKQSDGWISSATDIHPKALCFEADMPAGRARQIYWPHEEEGIQWAVESRSKKGWNRFVDHQYLLVK